MMNGKFLFVGTCVLALIVSTRIRISINNLSRYEDYPNIRQYLNRLIEFFDKENFVTAKNNFIDLIDHGFNPDQAFKLITSKVGQ